MKGLKHVSILSLLLVLLASQSYAQFNVGIAAAFNNYKNDYYKKAHPALQLRLGYDMQGMGFIINGGFNFSPTKYVASTYIPNMDPNNPEPEEYYIAQELKINNAFLHAGWAFFPPESDFHIRLFMGPSIDLLSFKWDLDPALPAIARREFTDTSMSGWKIDLGTGIDFRIGNGKLFAEFTLGLPANEKNGEAYLDNPAIGHRGIVLGYSYMFGRRDVW